MGLPELSHLPVKLLTPTAKLPTRSNFTDVGLDIYADEDVFISLGQTVTVSTGISLKLPDGYYGKLATRSSMGSKGIEVGAGIIDSGYTGEIKVVLHNLTHEVFHDVERVSYQQAEYSTIVNTYKTLELDYQVKKGDRIAQLIIQTYQHMNVYEVKELTQTDRGDSGFGSTGE